MLKKSTLWIGLAGMALYEAVEWYRSHKQMKAMIRSGIEQRKESERLINLALQDLEPKNGTQMIDDLEAQAGHPLSELRETMKKCMEGNPEIVDVIVKGVTNG